MLKIDPTAYEIMHENGTKSPFDTTCIYCTVHDAFVQDEGHDAIQSDRVEAICDNLVRDVSLAVTRGRESGTIHIDHINDIIELELRRREHDRVARNFRRML